MVISIGEFAVVMEDYAFLAEIVVGQGPLKICAATFCVIFLGFAAFTSEMKKRDFFAKKSSHF